jgi:hypothetical protein
MILAASILFSAAASAQTPTVSTTGDSLAGRPVRVIPLPDRALPPRLTGTLVRFAADSLTLRADSVQILTSRTDPTTTVRIPCAACIEARLALADVAKVELATLAPANAWKRTRRRGLIAGALVGGALFAAVRASRGDGNVPGAALPGALLGAWLGGTIGAGWSHEPTWETIYEGR